MSKLGQPLPDTVAFALGQLVWLLIDEEGSIGCGQVIAIVFEPGCVMFKVRWGVNSVQWHYALELTSEKPDQFKTC